VAPTDERWRDNSDLPEHRVAMIVFTTVRAVDELDGHHIVRHAIRSALAAESVDTDKVLLLARFRDAEIGVRVHDLIEVGTAARNGYLWTKPTGQAYPRVEDR
jgi:hypothetical protein